MGINVMLVGLILTSLPLINWIFEYCFSKKENKLNHFKRHFTCFYVDLLLIPFNLFAAFAISISQIYLVGLIILSFFAALILYPYWAEVHKKENKPGFFFNVKNGGITGAGMSHFIFQVIETTIILSFLVSTINNLFSYISSALLFIFFVLLLIGSKKIHGKILWSDALFGASGLILILIKLFFTF